MPTTDLQEPVSQQSESPALAIHHMTETSVQLTFISVELAVHSHPAPAQYMEVISQGWGGPAGVVMSNISLIPGQVRGSE